jgi:hypothetical protein
MVKGNSPGFFLPLAVRSGDGNRSQHFPRGVHDIAYSNGQCLGYSQSGAAQNGEKTNTASGVAIMLLLMKELGEFIVCDWSCFHRGKKIRAVKKTDTPLRKETNRRIVSFCWGIVAARVVAMRAS